MWFVCVSATADSRADKDRGRAAGKHHPHAYCAVSWDTGPRPAAHPKGTGLPFPRRGPATSRPLLKWSAKAVGDAPSGTPERRAGDRSLSRAALCIRPHHTTPAQNRRRTIQVRKTTTGTPYGSPGKLHRLVGRTGHQLAAVVAANRAKMRNSEGTANEHAQQHSADAQRTAPHTGEATERLTV